MDVIRLIGFDRETKTILWRQVYYIFALIIILMLSYEALFVYPLEWDNWGLTSTYMTKSIIISIILAGIYYIWGYIQLCSRVNRLEEIMETRE